MTAVGVVDHKEISIEEKKENDANNETNIIPIWSQDLKSDFVCSSKGTQSKSYQLYGQGILLATERSKRIVRAGRQSSSLVFEISSTSELFGQALAKVTTLSLSCRYQSECVLLHSSLQSLSKEFLDFSKSNKVAVVRPLQAALQSIGETIPSIHEKYNTAKQKVINKRSQCLRMRIKFRKACTETEAIILESTTQDEASKVNGKSGKGAKRLQNHLRDLLDCEVKYIDLVEELNQTVKETELLEKVGLDALQTMEQHRIEFLTDSIMLIVSNQSSAFDMKLGVIEEMTIDEGPTCTGTKTKSTNTKVTPFFKKLLPPSLSTNDEEDIGEMEAETFGLPPRVGVLRDEVKGCLREQEKRTQTFRTFSAYLKDVADACLDMGQATLHQLHQDGYGGKRERKSELLSTTMETEEGPILRGRWNDVVQSIEELALTTNNLATKLRGLREEKFSSYPAKIEKSLKAQSDSHDALWKLVCDTARNEMRAQERYELSTMQSEKARERAKSYDGKPAAKGGLISNGVTKMTPDMTKALGKVMSILPNGGEKAMKMIGSDTRRAIVKTSAVEADQRESKDKTTWKALLTQKDKSVQSYISTSEKSIESLRKEDKEGWQEILSALQNYNTMLQEYQTSVAQLIPEKKIPSNYAIINDLSTWTGAAKKELALKADSLVDDDMSSATLSVELSIPDLVSELIEILRNKKQESNSNQEEVSDSNGTISSVKKEMKYDLQSLAQGLDTSLLFPSKRESRQEKDIHQSLLSNFLKVDETPFHITSSFSCVYRPQSDQGHISRLHPGCIFLTERFFRFYEWGGKKLTVEWTKVKDIAKEKDLNGSLDNALRINSDTDTYFFSSFLERDATFTKIESLIKTAETKREQEEREKKSEKLEGNTVESEENIVESEENIVEPDAVLKKMKVIMSKSLKNVSMDTFYNVAWSEGQKTSAKPLYKDWLTKAGSKEIQVGDWKYGEEVNPWTKETFSEKRVIRFEFTRKTHLYIGPPVATIVQTQYCKHDNNRCILQMTVEIEGMPMADAFAVEIRWVTTRVNSNDLKVEVGLFVIMKKTTMFAKQIRSGALVDSKPVHVGLFEKIKATIKEESNTNNDDEEDDDDVDTINESETEEETTQTLLSSPLTAAKHCVLSAINVFWKQPSSTQVTWIVGFGILTLQISNWMRMNNIHKDIKSLHSELHMIRALMDKKES